MTNLLASLSAELAAATDVASASVVQVQTRRRPAAGVVFDTDLILVPGQHLDDDTAPVRRADGQTFEGQVLGRDAATGLAVVRATGLGAPAATIADEPRPGHLALAVGRTWSGGVFSALAPVTVVGGPRRHQRAASLTPEPRPAVRPEVWRRPPRSRVTWRDDPTTRAYHDGWRAAGRRPRPSRGR